MGSRADVRDHSMYAGIVVLHRKTVVPLRGSQLCVIACKRLELKTRSALYLRRHATPENLFGVSKRLIIEATNRIEARS